MDEPQLQRPSLFTWDKSRPGLKPGEIEKVVAPPDEMELANKIEALHKEASQKGFEEGRKKGLELGQMSFEKEVTSLKNLQVAFGTSLEGFKAEVTPFFNTIFFESSRDVMAHQMSLQPEHIKVLVDEALEAIGKKSRGLKLKINPQDKAYIDLPIEVILDSKITPGGCLLESEFAQLDATVETRLKSVLDTLTAKP